MEHIKMNEGIKQVLRTYLVPDEVISMIEEDNNIKIQAVADFYEKQLKDVEQEQEKTNKEQSEADFMEILRKHRITNK